MPRDIAWEPTFDLIDDDPEAPPRIVGWGSSFPTAHSRKMRWKRLEFDRFRCQVCGSRWHVEVHHLTTVRRGYELLNDLITLCTKHHVQQHPMTALLTWRPHIHRIQ